MVLTPAEKQKAYRQRQKQKAAGLLPEVAPLPALNLPTTGFSSFLHSREDYPSSVGYISEEMAIIHKNLELVLEGRDPEREIALVEKAIEMLKMSITDLPAMLNEFRRHQVDAEIARTKNEDLNDPTKQDEALARIVRLTEVRKHLNKKFRLELCEYEIPEE
jgi:hypothetical protein